MRKQIRRALDFIESHRLSPQINWRILVSTKDIFWRRINGTHLTLLRATREAKRMHTKGRSPDLLIAGFEKSGTNFLWRTLKQHSQIQMAPCYPPQQSTKEIDFFGNNWHRGTNWYYSLFTNDGTIQGEATARYASSHHLHSRIHQTAPNAKLILILREPVARAYSHYIMDQRDGRLSVDDTFENAIRIKPDFRETGAYITHLTHLLNYFPREQLLILITEEMRKNPQETLNQIFDFLGISHDRINTEKQSSAIHTYPPMNEHTKKHLVKYYQPYNEKLFQFLGRRIPEWEHANPVKSSTK